MGGKEGSRGSGLLTGEAVEWEGVGEEVESVWELELEWDDGGMGGRFVLSLAASGPEL